MRFCACVPVAETILMPAQRHSPVRIAVIITATQYAQRTPRPKYVQTTQPMTPAASRPLVASKPTATFGSPLLDHRLARVLNTRL